MDMIVVTENRFIQAGDSTRIKYVFDRNNVTHLAIEGGPTAPFKALKEGIWVVTVKPDKSKVIKAKFTIKYPYESYRYSNQTILVFEPELYKEVLAKYNELNKNGDTYEASMYINSFISEDLFKQSVQYK